MVDYICMMVDDDYATVDSLDTTVDNHHITIMTVQSFCYLEFVVASR